MKKWWSCLVGLSVSLFITVPQVEALTPRAAFDKTAAGGLCPPDFLVDSITLKFHEGTHVRLRDGQLVAMEPDVREENKQSRLGLTAKTIESDLAAALDLMNSAPGFAGLERMFSLDEPALAAWRAAAENQSGLELADLDLYFRISLAEGTSANSVADLVSSLNSLASVEIAQAAAPPSLPSDIAPPTPNFEAQGYQGYLDSAAAGGIDARYAWTIPGGRGQGVSIVDVENSWQTDHEDFPPVFYLAGNPSSGREHGTAVVGVLAAPDNGYGFTGIANLASIGLQSVSDTGLPNGGMSRVASAILKAANHSGLGGIVLVEQQGAMCIFDPSCPCDADGGNESNCARTLAPAEVQPEVFDAIRMVTAGGTIVVEAAANGSNSLDDPHYHGMFDRNLRDSGAILVAASKGSEGFGVPLCTSNYGSRVDVHAWGKHVATLGQDDPDDTFFFVSGNHLQDYTSNFRNTSAASPIVAGAAAVIQGVALAQGLPALSPAAMRDLLRETGTPQTPDTRSIGPIPNLRSALGSLGGTALAARFAFQCAGLACSFSGEGSTGATGWIWAFGDGTFGSGATVTHTYSASGNYVVRLTVQGGGGQSDSVEHSVQIYAPPTASFTVTCDARVCLADATGSTHSRDPVTYSFHFGGEGNSNGQYVAPYIQGFTYSAPGVYTVRLTVTDPAGSATATKSIVVRGDGSRAQSLGIQKESKLFLLGSQNSTSATYISTKMGPQGTAWWPVAGDWNGDGIDSVGKYDSDINTFYLRNSHSTAAPVDWTIAFGNAGDVNLPVAGDWDGDGIDTIGVFDATTGVFRLKDSNANVGSNLKFVLSGAQSSWLPIAGDWDGDGVDTVGLFDPATSRFYLRNSNTSGAADLSFVFGTPGSGQLPFAGDWNGDGWDSIGLFDPSNGRCQLRNLNAAGPADLDFTPSWAEDKPIAGDWDGL